MKLFRRLILRPLRKDPTRTVLSLLSIALGVAVVIAIELAGEAATGSFQNSLTSLLGKVDFEITANGGVDETYFAKLAALPINAHFSPMIEQPVVMPGRGSTLLYGVDAVGADDPETFAVVSEDLAARFGFVKGSTIELRGPAHTQTFKVQVIAKDKNASWVGIDIAAAQQLLDMYGRIDRIEVALGPAQDADAVNQAIKAIVPSSWDVTTPGARSEENRRMLRAFRWNLRILSYISLLVGAFLIYNTISVSVVRRRGEIGILRAIGVSANGVLLIFLGEASMLGLVGSIFGIALGRGLAAALLSMISDTVNALFVTSAPGTLSLPWESIAAALITGTGIAFISALIPAREAARVAPAEAMRRAITEHRARLHSKRNLAIAALCAAIAIALCQFGPIDGRPVLGYVATLLSVAATALAAPSFITAVTFALRGTLKRLFGAEGLIAGRSLVSSLSRTSVVVTALATAIAMMISVGTMVGSFRETVQVWLNSQLQADIYLRAQGPSTAGIYPPMSPQVPDIVAHTPGVAYIDVLHALEIHYDASRATLGGARSDVLRRHRTFRFLAGNLDGLAGHDRAIVTEPFADKHHVHLNDILHLELAGKTVNLTVGGIFYDYSSDRGLIYVDEGTLLKYLPDQPVTNVAAYLAPGVDPAKVRRDIQKRLADFPLMIAPNEALRRGAVEVFDRTFTVTYALEAVAIVVAMLGAANSLLALVLDRRREIGLIRCLGAATGQVRRMILAEAGLLGLLAGLLGLALGMALSLVLIYVINKQSFGWTIQFHPPVLLLAGALVLVWAFTVLAGVYPARFAAKLEPAEVIHEE